MRNTEYWSQCILRLGECGDRVGLSQSLSDKLYCGKCTPNEEIKLLQIIDECVKELKGKDKYLLISLPLFRDWRFEDGDMSRQYYKVEYVTQKQFKKSKPKSYLNGRRDMYIRI